MNLVGPIALATMAKIAAALAGLVVVAYILKLRRRRHEVPFTKLWQRVLREKDATSLWRKLKRLLSLMVQLAFLALLLGAALDPRLGQASASGRNVVVVIDASASMKALDDGPTQPARIEKAKDEARKILKNLGGADVAMVVRMDGQTTALSRFDSDSPQLMRVVDKIQPSDTPADLHLALQAASDALRGRKDPMIVIIGDGAYPADALERVRWERAEAPEGAPPPEGTAAPKSDQELGIIDLSGIDVRFVPVGKEGRNVGIVAFNVRRYLANKLSYEVLVEVQNFGTGPETVRLTLFAGDDPIDVKTLALTPGQRRREIYPDLGGGDDRALRARVEPIGAGGNVLPGDAFPLDDTAWALLPERKKQKVLLVTPDNLYLEGALLLDANIHVDKIAPEEYPDALATITAEGYDVVVYDGFTPAGGLPPSPAAIYFNPKGADSPFAPRGELKRPFISEVESDHPITRWVTLSDVNIDRSTVFVTQPGDVALARSIRDTVIVAGKRSAKKLVAFGFGLEGTDLMMRVAFPVMIVNSLDWFAGDDAELITTYRTGKTWSIPVDSEENLREVQINGPRGRIKAPVEGGRAKFYGQDAGIYAIDTGERTIGVAANLADPFESDITPEPKLTLGGRELGPAPVFHASVSRAIWIYLALAALLLSSIEWLTYNRRITV